GRKWRLNSSADVTSGGGDAIYVATVPLKATAGPPQLIMSMAYSLNIWNLQHFMVLIKPSSSIPQEVIVFDFQPVNPESAEAAVSIISGKSVPGSDSQTIISNLILKGIMPWKWQLMAIEFNSSWVTGLRVGFHDCRHYTNELLLNNLPEKYKLLSDSQEATAVSIHLKNG
ncbi:hypothetical protein F2Q70_00010425, partial [Brassica cretica]